MSPDPSPAQRRKEARWAAERRRGQPERDSAPQRRRLPVLAYGPGCLFSRGVGALSPARRSLLPVWVPFSKEITLVRDGGRYRLTSLPPALSCWTVEGPQVRNMLEIKHLPPRVTGQCVQLLSRLRVTFRLQLPSSRQVALQSELPAPGGPVGGFGSPAWRPPVFPAWPCCRGRPAFCPPCRHPVTPACLLRSPSCRVPVPGFCLQHNQVLLQKVGARAPGGRLPGASLGPLGLARVPRALTPNALPPCCSPAR